MTPELRQRIQDILSLLNIQLGPEQEEIFYDYSRLIIIGGGEGSSKTFMGALKAVCYTEALRSLDIMEGKREGRMVWVMAADFEDARMAMDGEGIDGGVYIVPWLIKLGIYDRTQSSLPTTRTEPANIYTTTGNTYKTVSAYDPLKVGREQPDFIVGEEVSRWEKEVWDRAYGRLARKYPHSTGFFSGSFESSLGWFPEVWKVGQAPNLLDIKSYALPSWANRAIYPGGYDDPAIQQLHSQTSEERFMERYGGRPTQPRDAVFPEFKVLLHVDVELQYDSGAPVYVFIDPGHVVYNVGFVQIVDDEVRVLDEVYVAAYTHEQVQQACALKPLWRHVRDGVMDVAGRAESVGGFGSPIEAWRRDTGLSIRSQYVRIDQSIERIRSVLAINPRTTRPFLRIHPKCRGLIAELGGGESPVQGGGMWKYRNEAGTPDNRNDHAIKALAYGLVALYGTVRPYHNDVNSFDPHYDPDVASYVRPI